jgi:hypothetical protein
MTDDRRQAEFVRREWREKRARRFSPIHPSPTDWDTARAIEENDFDIADLEIDADELRQIIEGAAVQMEVR